MLFFCLAIQNCTKLLGQRVLAIYLQKLFYISGLGAPPLLGGANLPLDPLHPRLNLLHCVIARQAAFTFSLKLVSILKCMLYVKNAIRDSIMPNKCLLGYFMKNVRYTQRSFHPPSRPVYSLFLSPSSCPPSPPLLPSAPFHFS